MLQKLAFRPCAASLGRQLSFVQNFRAYFSKYGSDSEADFDTARQWFQQFDNNTIPEKIAKTTFSRSSGPGGQKTNKTASKATTAWPFSTLAAHVPKVLHQGLRGSRYYAPSSDSISIQCDTHRSQHENKTETHNRLHGEISKIYKDLVPGVTSPETKKRVESLKAARDRIGKTSTTDVGMRHARLVLKQQFRRERGKLKHDALAQRNREAKNR